MAHLVPVSRLPGRGEHPRQSETKTHASDEIHRLDDYRDLTDVALRRRLEPERGLFLAEGATVIGRALAAGFAPRSALTAPRWAEALVEQMSSHDVPVFVADEEMLRGLTGYHVHRGALASMERRRLPTAEEVVRVATRLLVLEGVVEHANVGAAFRSAAALGFDGVLLDQRCADPLYRRSVKVSMGSVFTVPWTRGGTTAQVLAQLRSSGVVSWGLTPRAEAEALDVVAVDPPDRLALVLGTEGEGLRSAALAGVDRRVRIPMRAGVDSLNVAAAAAVACWAVRTPSTDDPG